MAGPVTSQYLQVEDVNVLKLVVALRRKGPIARALSKILNNLKKCDVSEVERYCRDTLEYSGKEFYKAFYKDDQKLLHNSVPFEDMDITLLYKLLQRICELHDRNYNSWTFKAEDKSCLEHSLFLLKNKRNLLCHDITSISNNELSKEFGEMISLLMNIFSKTGEKVGKDLSQEGQEVEKELNDLHQSSLPPTNLKEYHQSLNDIRKTLVSEVLREGKEDLQDLYSKFWIVSPVTWVSDDDSRRLLISKVYTPVQLEDTEVVDVDKVLRTPSSDGSLPRVICLTGIAGAGKTSICTYLTYCWCEDTALMSGLEDVDLLFVIQCRYVFYNSLKEYIINELLPKACSNLNDCDILPTLKKCNVLFVFDSLEEAGPEAKKLLEEALRWCPPCRVIITTRPESEDSAIKMIENRLGLQCLVKKFKILGFDLDKRKVYIEKLFSVLVAEETERLSKMNQFFSYLSTVEGVICTEFKLPLVLCLLVLLWLEDERKLRTVQTVSALYRELIDLSLCRLAEKLHRKTHQDFDDILHNCYKKFLYALGKESFNHIAKFEIYLDGKSVENIKKSCLPDIDPTQALSSLLICETTINRKRVIKHWAFTHRTFQEVLAAYYICESYEKNEIPLRFDKSHGPSSVFFLSVFVFALGLLHLKEPGSAVIMEQLGSHLSMISYQIGDDFILKKCVNILWETEKSERGKGIVDKLLKSREVDGEIVEDFQLGLENLCTLLMYTSLKVPPRVTYHLIPDGSRNSRSRSPDTFKSLRKLVKLLKDRHCSVRLRGHDEALSKEVDFLMEFTSIDFMVIDSDTAFDIGRRWAGHLKDQTGIILNMKYTFRSRFSIPGRAVPSPFIMPLGTEMNQANLAVWFIRGVQACIPNAKTVLTNDCNAMLHPNFSCDILYIASCVPLVLSECLNIGPTWSDYLLFTRQVIEKRRLSVKFSGSLYVTNDAHFSVILDNFAFLEQHFKAPLTITVMFKSLEKEEQVYRLGQRWGDMIKKGAGPLTYKATFQSGPKEVEFTVVINIFKGNSWHCGFVWKCCFDTLLPFQKCVTLFLKGVRLSGIQNGGMKIIKLVIGYECMVGALLAILQEWTPECECTIELTRMAVSDDVCTLINCLDTMGFQRSDFYFIVGKEEDFLYLATNMEVIKGFSKEYGLKLNFSHFRYELKDEIQYLCQEWVAGISGECCVKVDISFDEGCVARLNLYSSEGQQSVTFKQNFFGQSLFEIFPLFFAKVQENVNITEKLLTCRDLIIDFPIAINFLIQVCDKFFFSIEKPIVIKRTEISGSKLFDFCKMIDSHGASVKITDGLVIAQDCENDLKALAKNMEWSLHLFSDNHLKLLHTGSTLNSEHFKTLGDCWGKMVIDSETYVLKVECAFSQRNNVLVFSYESESCIRKMTWADKPDKMFYTPDDFSMYTSLLKFLQGFQKAGGNLDYGIFKLSKFDLAEFGILRFKRIFHDIPLMLSETTEFECAELDETFMSLLEDVEKRGSIVQISNCLVLQQDSLPLVLKGWKKVERLFKNSHMVFGLQNGRIPKDLYSFGKQCLQNLGISSMNYECALNDQFKTEIICEVDGAPSITWKPREVFKDNLTPKYEMTYLEFYIAVEPFLRAVHNSEDLIDSDQRRFCNII